MHDGSIAQGDAWLNNNLSAYATWAKANNSLLVVTWDEDDNGENNQIPTDLLRRERENRRIRRTGNPLQRAVHAGTDVRPEYDR